MSALADKMKNAGVDTDAARLRDTAENALRRSKQNEDIAFKSFWKKVTSDPAMLLRVVGEPLAQIYGRAYLRRVADDMRPNGSGASHRKFESQSRNDRPVSTPSSSRPSRALDDGQQVIDRPAAPATRDDAASPCLVESRNATDRRVAPATKISRSAALVAAGSGIWAKRVASHFEKTYGEITQYDYLNMRINSAVMDELKDGLKDVKWPDMRTPLKDFENPKRIEKLDARVSAARDRELNAVKGVAHVQ